jgi:hypothetical protein
MATDSQVCSGRNLCQRQDCTRCFNMSFASCDKAKYWSQKNEQNPRELALNSNNKFWFLCECNHTIEKKLSDVVKGTWCPYCCFPPLKLCSDDECQACFDKSMASSPKAKCWSPKNYKKPRDVFLHSHKKWLFDCDKCNHTIEKKPSDVTKGEWCPYCASTKLCKDETCEHCFNRSFASSSTASFWSSKNKESPREVFRGSDKKILFDCQECGHEFSIVLSEHLRGNWCPYCSNKKLCKNDCGYCFSKSFASSDRAEFWSLENKMRPRDIFLSSGKKYKFFCDKGHTFSSKLDNIKKGRWCSLCRHKTEQKLLSYLSDVYGSVTHQAKFEWAKNPETSKFLPYDFCLPDLKIIIELDGPQHFRQISNWGSPEDIQERDALKEQMAEENGYWVIRLLQEEVWDDKGDWKSVLVDTIKYITTLKLCVIRLYLEQGEKSQTEYHSSLIFWDTL